MRGRKRLFCVVMTLLALLLDTSVIPFTGLNTAYCPRLCVLVIITIALLAGEIQGIIYGALSGIILGFTIYTPASFTLILYVAIGAVSGFIGRHMRPRFITIVPPFISLFGYEFANAAYFYISASGRISNALLLSALIRLAIAMLLLQLMFLPFHAVLDPPKLGSRRNTR